VALASGVACACWLAAPAAAAAFVPVSGSPFATGPYPADMKFSPSGELLATSNLGVPLGSGVPTTSIFSVGSNGSLSPAPGSPFVFGAGERAGRLSFHPSGELLALTSTLGHVHVLSVSPEGELAQIDGSPFPTGSVGPYDVEFSPTGELLAVPNREDGTVLVFDVSPSGALSEVEGSPFETSPTPNTIAFSPSGELLATTDVTNGRVSVFAVAPSGALTPVSGSPFASGGGSGLAQLAFSPSGELLAVPDCCDPTQSLFLFSVAPNGALTPAPGSPFVGGPTAGGVAFSPSGELLAVANGNPGLVTLLSLSPAGTPIPVSGSPFAVPNADTVAFDPSGTLLAATNYRASNAAVSMLRVGPPSAVVGSPASGEFYGVGEPVPTTFSCAPAPYAPGVDSCTDSNGDSASNGHLDTSALGPHTYTVTATSADAQTGTASISYTVVAPPGASIASPAAGGTYVVGQSVATAFSCAEGAHGPGLSSCDDSTGGRTVSGGSGHLDTSTPGARTYIVTATSKGGMTDSVSIPYTVVPAPPTATIVAPLSKLCMLPVRPGPDCPARYAVGQSVRTIFSCAEGAGGPGLASCDDSTGTKTVSGGSGHLDTSTPGTHTYTVTATSRDGRTGRQSIVYNVTPPPLAIAIVTPRAIATRGRTTLRLACDGGPSGSACRGTLSLRLRKRLAGRPGTKFKTIVLGRARYTVASGRTRRVALRLSDTALRLLRHAARHRLRVKATAKPTAGRGSNRAVSLKLKPPPTQAR